MLAFERSSQHPPVAPGSGRLTTRRLNPNKLSRLQQQQPPIQQQSNTQSNDNVQQNNDSSTQQSNTSRLPIEPQRIISTKPQNLHSTPVPSSRGLKQRNVPQQSEYDDSDDNNAPQDETQWLELLQRDNSSNNNNSNNNNVLSSVPKPVHDQHDKPSLYSPKQFSPRRLNNGQRRAADYQGTVTESGRDSSGESGASSIRQSSTGLSNNNAPTLGLGTSSRVKSNYNAPKWDLSKFNSPSISPRRLSNSRSIEKVSSATGSSNTPRSSLRSLAAQQLQNQIQSNNDNTDLPDMLAKANLE